MKPQPSQRGVVSLLASLVLIFSVSGVGHAQQTSESMRAQQQEFQQLRQSLSQIREQAMSANPALKKRQDSLQDQMMSRMRDEGVKPRSQIRRLQDITRELRAGEVPEEEQAALMQEYQQTRQALLQARRTAMQDERVRSAQIELQEDMMAAMAEQNGDVEMMIQRFDALREELSNRRRNSDVDGQ